MGNNCVWGSGYQFSNAPEGLLDDSFALWAAMMFEDRSSGLHEWDAVRGWSNYFGQQRSAMQITDLTNAFYQANHAVPGSSINWGIAPLPSFPGHTPVTPNSRVTSAGIPYSANHPEEAWEVLKLLIQPEASSLLINDGLIPALMTPEVWDRYRAMKTASEPRMPTGLDAWASRPLYIAGREVIEAEHKAREAVYVQTNMLLDGQIQPSQVLQRVKEALGAP